MSMATSPTKRDIERFWKNVFKGPGCWECRPELPGRSYRRVSFCGRTQLAHRVSYKLAFGDIPEGKLVCHHCDNRLCVRPDHLFLGTAKDNSQDAVRKGRICHGERHPFAKLTEEVIARMADMRRDGLSYQEIAAEFGVSWSAVHCALSGLSWKHVELDPSGLPQAVARQYGAKNHAAKLTESDIPKIFELASRGLSHKKIGDLYGVHKSAIQLILARKTWVHVPV